MESKKPESTTSHVDSAPRLRPAASATYSAYLCRRRAGIGARCGQKGRAEGRTHSMWNFVEMTPSFAFTSQIETPSPFFAPKSQTPSW